MVFNANKTGGNSSRLLVGNSNSDIGTLTYTNIIDSQKLNAFVLLFSVNNK